MKYVSVAPYFKLPTSEADIAGHWVKYQYSLRQAALKKNHEFVILTGESADKLGTEYNSFSHIVPVLSSDNGGNFSGSIGEFLEKREYTDEQTIVFLYEGGIWALESFCHLAQRFKKARFALNLFSYNNELNAPSGYTDSKLRLSRFALQKQAQMKRLEVAIAALSWPGNLSILADTDRRVQLARSYGIPVKSSWRSHSLIADEYCPKKKVTLPEDGLIKVLIPLSKWQITKNVLQNILQVSLYVSELMKSYAQIEWHVAGYLPPDITTKQALKSLRSSGMHVHPGALAKHDYALQFASFDAVWMPIQGLYNTQSSGKALDALVQGVPIIAPSGTYGAVEQERWVNGSPSYITSNDAIEVFLHLPRLLPHLSQQLQAANESIRRNYSPEATLSHLEKATAEDLSWQAFSTYSYNTISGVTKNEALRKKKRRTFPQRLSSFLSAVFIVARVFFRLTHFKVMDKLYAILLQQKNINKK